MAVPSWFDEYTYLQSKLNQLKSAGQTQYTNVTQVKAAIEAAGMSVYEHFEKYSLAERTSPNTYFNTQEYLEAKAKQLNTAQGVTTWTADKVALEFQNAGFTNAYEHFSKYGWAEGVNPSNSFDVSSYFDAKAAATGKTVAEVKAAFAAAGLDPIAHYTSYGKGEGIAVTAVPASEQVTPASSSGSTGQTFTLTTGADTATANVFEAPSVVTQVGALLDTLQSTDKLTGTGTNPTLNVTLSSIITSTPQLTGIETINVMPEVAAQTLNLSKATGLKAINIDSSQQDMTILGVQSNVTVGVSNGDGVADTLVRFADSVTSGGADVAKVVLTNNGNPAVASGQVINLSGTTVGGFETLEITANGTNRINEILSDVAAAIGAAATATNSVRTVKVAGDGSLRIDTPLNSTTTFDATGNKGGVNVILNNTGNISVKGGDGNDTFDLQGTLTNNDTVDGGGGRDTLAVSAGTGLGVGNKVSNIEILRVNGAAGFTFDNDDLTTVDAIVHNSTAAMTYQDMAVAAAADSAKGLTILNNGAVTYNLKGVGGLGATDQGLYVKIGSDTAASALQTVAGRNTGTITTDASSLTLDVKAFGGQTALGTGAITANNITTLTIKGGAPGEAFTVSTGAAFGTPGTLTKIDAGSFSGDLTVSGNAGAQAIIGGTGGDSLATGGRGAATTLGDLLHGGAGNDTFVFAAADSTAAIPNAAVAGAFTAAQKALFTQIDDLNLGGATAATAADALDLRAVSAGITNTLGNHVAVVNGGAATALSGADFGTAVGALLAGTGLLHTAANLTGNTAAAGLFTWGGETFLIATDGGTVGYTAGDDIVINVTGVTGTLDSADFV